MKLPDLITDPEIEALKQRSSADKYVLLEKDIMMKGCITAIEVWRGTILDGQKRYEICKKHRITFKTVQFKGQSQNEAYNHVCKMQLNRTDLTHEWRKYLIGRQYFFERCIALESARQKLHSSDKVPASEKIATIAAKATADYNSISAGTVRKYYLYAVSLEKVKAASPALFQKLIDGEVKASHENTLELSHLPEDDIRHVYESILEDGKQHIVLSDIRHSLSWRRYKVQSRDPVSKRRARDPSNAEIKKMPEYDPDAYFSTLALTIPSWMNLISKTQNNADFAAASADAKTRLYDQLSTLYGTVEAFMRTLKEAPNER